MKPYDYQQEVINKGQKILNEYNMLYLAAETRTGKTLIALSLAEHNGSTLFVTTKSAIKGVQDTLERSELFLPDIHITNYEQLHKLDLKEYDVVIADECHKISSFPKPNLARIRLAPFIGNDTKLILMSGTPHVESTSQMYHQFSLHPLHPFAEYRTFYKWFKKFGIPRLKFVGRGIRANDYSCTINFAEYYRHFTIMLTREDAGFEYHTPKINRIYIDMPDWLHTVYNKMKTHHIFEYGGNIFVSESGGASLLTKLQQIASGTCINEVGGAVLLDTFKVDYIKENYDLDSIVVLYKYTAEAIMLEKIGVDHLQIDSGITGVDMSHKERIVAMTLTFSGANFIQAITRLANKERDTPMEVDILLANETIDSDILDIVQAKKNFNIRTYYGK
jgi:hypothetical protein